MNLESPDYNGAWDTRLMDPNKRKVSSGNSWRSQLISTTPFPDILQPETQRIGLEVKTDAFDRHNSRLQGMMQLYDSAEDWRKPEILMDYSLQKTLTDGARIDLSKQKANLSNAEWLEFRDKQIRLLEESNPEFAKDASTVRRLGQDYHKRMVANHKKFGKAYADMGRAGFLFTYISDGYIPPGFNSLEEAKAAYEKLRKEARAALDGIQETGGTHEQAMAVRNSDEFTEAHVRTQETLRKAGLNKKGVKLAGRLLAATPYDEFKSLVNAARTGGIVDAEGNFPSPEEIRERFIEENYQATVDALAQGAVPYTDERWAEKQAEWKAQAAEEAAKKKEKSTQRRIELNNKKLSEKGMNH